MDIDAFESDCEDLMTFLQEENDAAAQQLYNSRLRVAYDSYIQDPDSVAYTLLPFWLEIDEYLNNAHARTVGVATLKSILDYYSSDFSLAIETIKKASLLER